jgi:hypothetical protein
MKMENLAVNTIKKEIFIEHEREGTYFTLPFSMPAETESITLTYRYTSHIEEEQKIDTGRFVAKPQASIIDLGLIAPDGRQVGASGSNKTEIYISETYATPGYKACALVPGEWQIIIGAYKIAAAGVEVTYEITFTKKSRRLFKGDLHIHTCASDGIFTAEELMERAQKLGLDFIAITDHNQMISADELPKVRGFNVIQGMEYTHFLGHSNFLGVDKPYEVPFIANTFDEVSARFHSADERGALIVINHPFQEPCEFKFDMMELPFHCLEIWNGPMRESNLKAIGLWQRLLTEGKRIPISGGSDFHRDDVPFTFMGGPTTCVYATSNSSRDILTALREGHAFISYAPKGPTIQITAGDAIMGDQIEWAKEKEFQIDADNLVKGDILQIITATEKKTLLEAQCDGSCHVSYRMQAPGFARIEIARVLIAGLPLLPVLISNPIYFV